MEQEKPKFAGVEIDLGGQSYIIPPLSLRQMKEYAEKLLSLGTVRLDNFLEKLDVAMPIIAAAFKRNYPDMTEEKLLDLVDVANFKYVIQAINGTNGLKEAKAGETRPVPELTGQISSVQ